MLSQYRVLDLSDNGAQICGQILGDLGADVVLIEPTGGSASRRSGPWAFDQRDPNKSLTFWGLNRNKRGIVLDVATSEGQAELRRMVATADFLIESYAPGYLDGLGLGYTALSAINPRLVMVSITPFGQTGPKANWVASDFTVWASSGAMIMAGDDDRPPVGLSVPQSGMHAGAEGAAGALIAHLARERDGLGQQVDVSAQTATMMATQATILASGWGDAEIKRLAGGVNFGGIPLKFVNPAKDGYVSVTFLFGTAMGPFSRRLMEIMHVEGFVDEATRDKDWINYTGMLMSGQEPISELLREIEAVSQFTRTHTKAELFAMGLERGLLIVPVATIDEMVNSAQLASRNYWHEVEHPELGRSFRYPGDFAKWTSAAESSKTPRRPPLLGEHTTEVAAETIAAALSAPAPRPSVAMGAPRALPLEGVKVLDFAWVVACPWGTRYLADYGATVLKVESTGKVDTIRTIGPFKDHVAGPERSGAHATVNAGKLGITLNLASPEGRELALKLVAWADVVTESFSPGAMDKFGLGYEALRTVNPDVIMISSCLNGQTGPQKDLAGFGTMGLQLAGFGEIAGWPDRGPAGPGGAYTDYIAPKFTAAAILAALDHRRRTGEGRRIDLSQGEASVHFLAPAVLDYTVNGRVTGRYGNASLQFAPHGAYPVVGDDAWVAIVATDEAQWRSLCAVTGNAAWMTESRFVTLEARLVNAGLLDVELGEWTASRTAAEVEQLLQGAGVPAHRVFTSSDAFADDHLAARRHLLTVDHPDLGPVPIENSRMIFSATPANVTTPGPTFGQHSQEVLSGILGLNDEAIGELAAASVLE